MNTEELIQKLDALLKLYAAKEDIETVHEAVRFSTSAHDTQMRKSGVPYINHPLEVAIILAELKQDTTTIIAALLHDVLEDTGISAPKINAEFGEQVVLLVEGVTKLGKIYFGTRVEAKAENYRKMFLAMAEDIRVVIIKLADRLHNMRTLRHLPEHKQIRIAKETRDIYVPLAHRLGIGSIKWELEDLSFQFLEPDAYHKIKESVSTKRAERQEYIDRFILKVKDLLTEAEIEASVYGRPKHFYSIYRKLTHSDMSFDELFDLLGIRIIAKNINECYASLGVIHSAFKPVPGRIKDYVAMPKTNMYQSLHSTVIGPEGKPIEIQIRTEEMHQIAEYGIAAHWKYKSKSSKENPPDVDMTWLRRIVETQQEDAEDSLDADQYLQKLKIDLFEDEVFIFTPHGDVQVLPKGATPIDFAYKIHSDVGSACSGARVNGYIVPLSYKLQSGDRVEILTSKSSTPKLDWLKIVVTNQAKSRIKSFYKKKLTLEKQGLGRDELEQVLKEEGLKKSILNSPEMQEFYEKYHLKGEDDLAYQVGCGALSAKTVTQFLTKQLETAHNRSVLDDFKVEKQSTGSATGIRVLGENNVAVNVGKCCHPLPGDALIGFITIGHGVTVHRIECNNILKLQEKDKARLVQVEWDSQSPDDTFPVRLQVEVLERNGILNDVISRLLELKCNIREVSMKPMKDGNACILVQVDLKALSTLEKIKTHIGKLPDVLAIYRPRSTN